MDIQTSGISGGKAALNFRLKATGSVPSAARVEEDAAKLVTLFGNIPGVTLKAAISKFIGEYGDGLGFGNLHKTLNQPAQQATEPTAELFAWESSPSRAVYRLTGDKVEYLRRSGSGRSIYSAQDIRARVANGSLIPVKGEANGLTHSYEGKWLRNDGMGYEVKAGKVFTLGRTPFNTRDTSGDYLSLSTFGRDVQNGRLTRNDLTAVQAPARRSSSC